MNWLAEKLELSRGGDADNVRPMEGLRGFAVFLVFLVHYVSLIEPFLSRESRVAPIATAIHTIGNCGVDLFFVLSGFLIYGSLLERKQAFRRFISRRIERIYPTFIVVFVVYVGLSFSLPAESKIPSGFTAGIIYLLQNFLLLPGIFPIKPLITVAWSLSYEMLYYFLIPLVISVFALRDRSPLWRVGFFIVFSVLIAGYCAAFGGHVRLIMFFAGILLYEAMRSKQFSFSPPSWVGLTALLTGLLGTLLPIQGSAGYVVKIVILFVTLSILCLACFRSPAGWLARAFSWTPLRWLGNISYSYYLLHGLALKVSFILLSALFSFRSFEPWLFWPLLPAMFLMTLPPTVSLFLLVERPWSLTPSRAKGKLRSPPTVGV